MKKISVLATFVALSAALYAQPKLTYTDHALRSGDVHQTRAVTYCEPLQEGAGQVWDYSGTQITGAVYNEALGEGTAPGNIAVSNDDGVLFNFNVTNTGNEYYGYALKNYSVVYEQPILKTRFPLVYLDQHSGAYGGYVLANNTRHNIEGTYSSTADAYGTLILPNGVVIENALRVKTTEVHKEGNANNQVELTKYLWYAPSLRYPAFVTHIWNTTQGGTFQKTSHVSVEALNYVPAAKENNSPVAASRLSKDVAYKVYPTTVESSTNVTYTLTQPTVVTIKVYDMNGNCQKIIVSAEEQAEGNYEYTYTPTSVGIHIVSFKFGTQPYNAYVVKK
ncbi:hypothetical protein AGMMS4956_02460 [Bacteroidia bacterium]|nr:hypothetical protein AGMMS4956_02460 [Bacteroidia bacterium]